MAGTINFAMTQQFDMNGDPLSGGLLYFFAAGTTTPQTPYQDTGLTIAFSNPIVLDSSGRVPMFYLADGFIKIRLSDKNGVTVIAADQLLVIGPSSGSGGGGGAVDPATVLATGDIKARYGTGPLTGFVRCNGNSIGKTGSGATELASDTLAQALFEYLWAFPNITLNTGKGATAHADFLAGRQLNLPDLRGRAVHGMDDMGAAATNRLTTAYFGQNATVLGAVGGNELVVIDTTRLPAHVHSLSSQHFGGSAIISQETADHTHRVLGNTFGQSNAHQHLYNSPDLPVIPVTPSGATLVIQGAVLAATSDNNADHTHAIDFTSQQDSNHHDHSLAGSTQSIGGGLGAPVASPAMVMTIYIKL